MSAYLHTCQQCGKLTLGRYTEAGQLLALCGGCLDAERAAARVAADAAQWAMTDSLVVPNPDTSDTGQGATP